jgi:hypothetical protein
MIVISYQSRSALATRQAITTIEDKNYEEQQHSDFIVERYSMSVSCSPDYLE